MTFSFKKISEAEISSGTRVFLAVDFNVPIQNDKVIDPYRITRSVKTLDFLKVAGARTLLVSHRSDETASLFPVYEYLKTLYPVVFAKTISEASSALESAKDGTFVLLENIRRFPGEKENDEKFSQELASLAEVYVNEAFSISHRPHASIIGVPKFLPSFAGFLFTEEVTYLSKAFNPQKPFIFLLAGAKFETKFPLVKKFLELADSVFIGGALANDLFLAKGYEIGRSKHAEKDLDFADIIKNPKLILPVDVVTESGLTRFVKDISAITDSDDILDAGPKTIEELKKKFAEAKFILWNGPLGAYEQGFTEGTESLAKAITESFAESVVGGGDTLAVIAKLNLSDKFFFVSTGGGAMLDFLANGTLPGISALEASAGIMN